MSPPSHCALAQSDEKSNSKPNSRNCMTKKTLEGLCLLVFLRCPFTFLFAQPLTATASPIYAEWVTALPRNVEEVINGRLRPKSWRVRWSVTRADSETKAYSTTRADAGRRTVCWTAC